MLKAIGISARRLPDTTIEVRARLIHDDGRLIAERTFMGPTLVAIRQQIQAALVERRDAELDMTLTQAVVDQELGSI